MRSRLLGCLMILVLVGSFVAVPVFAEDPEEPTGTLVVLSAETFTGSWDPTGHTVLANMHAEWNTFDRLIAYDAEAQELVPRLATEWEFVDPTTLQMTLREGVKFHDGSDFEASDVKASLERWSDPEAVGASWWAQQVEVDVIDDNTVQIKSPEPYASLPFVLTYAHIMSSDDIANPDQLTSRMNGTGPFKFVKYEDGAITFEANMDGWDGPPKVKEFVFQYVPDPATRLAALQTGEAHITERVETEQVPMIEADPNLTVIAQPATEQKWLNFTHPIPPMENEALRRALAYAVDRETIVNDILQGFGKLSESHLSPEQWSWTPMENLPSYDPAKAAELLEEAGYPGGEGLDDLVYYTSVGFYPKTKEYGEYMTSNWSDVGVDVEFRPMEVAAWLEVVYEPTLTMGDGGWMSPNVDPDMLLYALFRSRGENDMSHWSFYKDDEVNAVIDAEGQETDMAKRKEILQTQTLPTLADKLPMMPLFTSMLIYAHTNDVEGFVTYPTSMFDLKDVSIAE